jgi:hypothetical protein
MWRGSNIRKRRIYIGNCFKLNFQRIKGIGYELVIPNKVCKCCILE